MTATLTIEKADYDLSNITFNDKTFAYDGLEKEITISGALPAGVSVSYSNNKMTNPGGQTATATFTGDSNHNVTTKTASLTIKSANYELNGDSNSYTLTNCSDSFSGMFTIPSTFMGKDVTAIGTEAFKDCEEITSITVPQTIKTINSYAFSGCTKLKSINLLDNITTINSHTFDGCSSLESISLPNDLDVINSYAFSACTSLETIDIPSDVTEKVVMLLMDVLV